MTFNSSIVATGFSNGFIAILNLDTKSPLLRRKKGSTTFLLPYKHFYGHSQAVTSKLIHKFGPANKRLIAFSLFQWCT